MKTNKLAIGVIIVLLVVIAYLVYLNQQPHTTSSSAQRFGDVSGGVVPQIILVKEAPPPPASRQQPPPNNPFPPTYVDDVLDPNVNRLSYWNYTDRKATERIVNPLLPPERSYTPTYGVPINVPTRGLVGGYQQVGMLYKDEIDNGEKKPGNNTDSTVIALYGRPVDTSRNKWSYYATGDGFQAVKIPVSYRGRKCDTEFGCEEITSNDDVKIAPYNGVFKAEIYDYDKPRYIPSVW